MKVIITTLLFVALLSFITHRELEKQIEKIAQEVSEMNPQKLQDRIQSQQERQEGRADLFGSSTPLHDGFKEKLGDTPLGDLALNGCESPKYQSLSSFQGVCRYSSELRGSRSANQP